jgi:molybdopterin molybdotransferase
MLTGLSWQEAQGRLLEWARPLGTDTVRLRHALSHYSAVDVPAQSPYPAHNLAEERGYTLSYDALKAHWDRDELPLFRFGGNLGGRRTFERKVSNEQAMLVDVGAFLPDAYDLVVPEDEVERRDNEVEVKSRPERYSGVIRRGQFIPEQKAVLSKGHRISYAGYTAFYGQQVEEAEVLRKPVIGSLILGSGLHDPNVVKAPKDSTPELLSPMMMGLYAHWQFPFISLGIQESHISVGEVVSRASEQAEILVVSGILSSSQWQDFTQMLGETWELRIEGLSHPLCGRFCVAACEGRWLFFLPYHPPMIQALLTLLVFPFVTRMMGDERGYVPFVSARSLETVEAKNPQDDIWVGREESTGEFMNVAQVKLICQISSATLTTLVEGTCFAVPRASSDHIEAHSDLAIVRY